ncbi:uncharacterized protein METZ01_LOCUS276807 [marine metagenome]|uniref:Uncharacterized protein n=1 Tax=marine metagenome TaxID=408172 RepID=A0A382KKH7_9ZZZZ
MLFDFGEIGEELDMVKVPDGKQNHQSIFELEDRFDNSGHKQGMKYNSEQRMKTLGY